MLLSSYWVDMIIAKGVENSHTYNTVTFLLPLFPYIGMQTNTLSY